VVDVTSSRFTLLEGRVNGLAEVVHRLQGERHLLTATVMFGPRAEVRYHITGPMETYTT
jgi:hypothetical protein